MTADTTPATEAQIDAFEALPEGTMLYAIGQFIHPAPTKTSDAMEAFCDLHHDTAARVLAITR